MGAVRLNYLVSSKSNSVKAPAWKVDPQPNPARERIIDEHV